MYGIAVHVKRGMPATCADRESPSAQRKGRQVDPYTGHCHAEAAHSTARPYLTSNAAAPLFSPADAAVTRTGPGFPVDCRIARHIPLNAFRLLAL